MTIRDIFNWINDIAPFADQESWDNSGFMVGDLNRQCTGVVLTLDVTKEAVATAVSTGANVILAHHPMIFHPLRSVDANSLPAQCLLHGITVLSAHTNLDKAANGVNDVLASVLNLSDVSVAEDGMCRIGKLPAPMTAEQLADHVKKSLGADVIRYTNSEKTLTTVGICGGSGGGFWRDLRRQGCDAVVTGDLHHDVLVDASNEGYTVVDGTHYFTENPVMKMLQGKLAEKDVPAILMPACPPYCIK